MKGQDFQGVNAAYVAELYDRYRQDPSSVDPATRAAFDGGPVVTEGVIDAGINGLLFAGGVTVSGRGGIVNDPAGTLVLDGSLLGDTTNAERQRLVRKPPHILITTPESLHLLLTSLVAPNQRRPNHVAGFVNKN